MQTLAAPGHQQRADPAALGPAEDRQRDDEMPAGLDAHGLTGGQRIAVAARELVEVVGGKVLRPVLDERLAGRIERRQRGEAVARLGHDGRERRFDHVALGPAHGTADLARQQGGDRQLAAILLRIEVAQAVRRLQRDQDDERRYGDAGGEDIDAPPDARREQPGYRIRHGAADSAAVPDRAADQPLTWSMLMPKVMAPMAAWVAGSTIVKLTCACNICVDSSRSMSSTKIASGPTAKVFAHLSSSPCQ